MWFVVRYELAQQLQQQPSSSDMQPAAVVAAESQGMLEVVGDGQQVELSAPLVEDSLQDTGKERISFNYLTLRCRV